MNNTANAPALTEKQLVVLMNDLWNQPGACHPDSITRGESFTLMFCMDVDTLEAGEHARRRTNAVLRRHALPPAEWTGPATRSRQRYCRTTFPRIA